MKCNMAPWLILILVMFLPPVVLVIHGKTKSDKETQKAYNQLAIVYLVASFVVYGVALINF